MTLQGDAEAERYVAGLRAHDVDAIGATVSDDLRFVAATKTLDKPAFLSMVGALYAGFPDWSYDYDPPRLLGDGSIAVHSNTVVAFEAREN